MKVDADFSLLSPVVRTLVEAAVALREVAPAEVHGTTALEDTRALLLVKEQLETHLLQRLRDIELRQLHELDAMPSAGTWIEAQTTSVDRRQVALARRLDRLPAVRRELDSGRLSVLSAQRVALAVERVRGFLDRPDGLIDGLPAEDVLSAVLLRGVPQLYGEALGGLSDDDLRLRRLLSEMVTLQGSGASQVARVEEAFVALAARVESRSLRPALEQLVDALLPQQLEDRSARAHARPGLALHRNSDGTGWRLEADLDDETGELLHTTLTAAMATDPENVDDSSAAAGLRGVEDPAVRASLPAPRRAWERRHDALKTVLRDWLGSGVAGSRGKVVPHLLVRVSVDALAGVPGALPAVGRSGHALPASLVRRWSCDSAITRFVMGLGNQVLEMSHTARTLKAHERKAKLMETGDVCQAAGCHPPPGTPLIPHHPEAYARSGLTSFYDTVMFCDRSHDDLHVGGKTLLLKDGRLLGPDGWVSRLAS
ncbi:MAG: 13E12 repeat family protein [Actinobacteria bacterium]|nr:13E12 repeat family protein [Actinomycetota bacterium]MCA1720663.1 13E12 repeat family protein [Actinomycetota bacterium]